MSRDVARSSEEITSIDQLVAYFHKGIKPAAERRIGMEHEKFLLQRETLDATPYEGPSGIGAVFKAFARDHGFDALMNGDNITALVRSNAEGRDEALTIEPGGQFELSGAPLRTMEATAQEFDAHLEAMRQIGEELGVVAIGTGINPLHDLDQIPWMPTHRHAIMRRYMSRVGNLGHWMMKGTCTVQANFDYTSEVDACDMLRTALHISPIASALFAHSPLWRNRPSGYMTTRCYIWTDTDADRCGFPPALLARDSFSFRDYVEYALDVPMYFIHRDGAYLDLSGHSFRRFLQDGHEHHRATMGDFELHLSTLFPEVRMKRYIEVRGADMGGRDHALALPAFWKGLLYDATARQSARDLLGDLPTEARALLFDRAIRWSLNAPSPPELGSRYVLLRHVARDLVQFASDGLDRLAQITDDLSPPIAAPNERRFLDPLKAALDADAPSTAHALLDRWRDLDRDTAKWVLTQAL